MIVTVKSSRCLQMFFFVKISIKFLSLVYRLLTELKTSSKKMLKPKTVYLWYQCQASGLMGSPTVPRTFRELRSKSWTPGDVRRKILCVETFIFIPFRNKIAVTLTEVIFLDFFFPPDLRECYFFLQKKPNRT